MANRRNRPLAHLDTDALACRARHHLWEDVTGILPGPRVEYIRATRFMDRCTRCGTVRSEVWNIYTGQLITRMYTYADGYSLGAFEVAGEYTRKDIARLELLQRMREAPAPRRRARSA
jgi:hypothetical protein